MGEFRMPALGASMEEGTLIEWLRHPGDAVRHGDIVAVVDTEKGAIEIEVFEDGVLDAIRVHPGEKVPVGTVLATIRGREVGGAATPAASPVTPPASPGARKLARERGVDVTSVQGTGPRGAITRGDVERAAGAAPPPVPPAADPASRMRQAIAAAMARSKREIPHFYLGATIDMHRALTWLSAENGRRAVIDRLLPAALLIKAVARALEDVPELNGFWENGASRPGAGIHPGVAVSLRGGGLVAPAIHDANLKDLSGVMTALREVVMRARDGKLRGSEVSDPTITITNLGEQGVEIGYGIIHPPQIALVSFGRMTDRPLVVNGAVEVRPSLTATVSADHRAVDGHRAGLFLAAVDRHLQKPEAL